MSQQPADGSPNWLGLLQWSLAYQDGTAPTNIEIMTPENREWLEGVLREGVIDEPKRIGDVVLSVKTNLENDTLSPSDVDDLEEVTDITEQIDMAGIFVKLGGFKLAYMLLASYGKTASLSDAVLSATLSLVGTVCQNHPTVQEQAFNTFPGYIQSLYSATVDLLSNIEHSLSPALQSKCLFALSAIVRGHGRAEGVFISKHYASITERLLISNDFNAESCTALDSRSCNVIGKLFFLSSALLASELCSVQRVEVIAKEILPICAKGIQEQDVNIRDNAVGVVQELLLSEPGRRGLLEYQSGLCAALDAVNERLRLEARDATDEDIRQFVAEDSAKLAALQGVLAGDLSVNSGLRSLLPSEDSEEVLLLGP